MMPYSQKKSISSKTAEQNILSSYKNELKSSSGRKKDQADRIENKVSGGTSATSGSSAPSSSRSIHQMTQSSGVQTLAEGSAINFCKLFIDTYIQAEGIQDLEKRREKFNKIKEKIQENKPRFQGSYARILSKIEDMATAQLDEKSQENNSELAKNTQNALKIKADILDHEFKYRQNQHYVFLSKKDSTTNDKEVHDLVSNINKLIEEHTKHYALIANKGFSALEKKLRNNIKEMESLKLILIQNLDIHKLPHKGEAIPQKTEKTVNLNEVRDSLKKRSNLLMTHLESIKQDYQSIQSSVKGRKNVKEQISNLLLKIDKSIQEHREHTTQLKKDEKLSFFVHICEDSIKILEEYKADLKNN
jgi:hypothetical protein